MGDMKVFALVDVERSSGGDGTNLIVIHDKVYDVAKFLDEHPGGEEILMDARGRDATDDFEDVGHSTDARELMKKYCVGVIREEDKSGSKDRGEKSWPANADSGNGSNWVMWLAPLVLAFMAAAAYRFYS